MANRTVLVKDKDRLIEKIVENGYSYRQLADKAGISQTSISLIIKGERNPSPKNAVKKRTEDTNIILKKDGIFFSFFSMYYVIPRVLCRWSKLIGGLGLTTRTKSYKFIGKMECFTSWKSSTYRGMV